MRFHIPYTHYCLILTALTAFAPTLANGQGAAQRQARSATSSVSAPPPPDSLRQTLDAAEISATRATALDPVPFAEVKLIRTQAAYSGQELPVFLQRTPNVVSNAEAGSPFGYTNFRLRGIDQTRLNITLDGIPLNEPEDQGAYFVNLPGFADFIESVQIQRGTGLTPNGTAPLGGSLNFLTTKPDGSGTHLQGSLTGGAFGTGRGSVGYRTGPTTSGFSALVRGTYQQTDGYRRNGFHKGGSGVGALSWTRKRTVVRLLFLAGDAQNGASYVASSDSAIARNRRDNPLAAANKDHFRQQTVGLTVSHATGERGVWTTTLYGTRLRGAYDVLPVDTLLTFGLASGWGGVISAWQLTAERLDFTAGIHASRYARTHTLTDAGQEQYRNTGHWGSETAFAKAAWRFGPDPHNGLRAFADIGVRHSAFRYAPDAQAGLKEEPTLDWTFINPKVGLTWVQNQFSAFASIGRTQREPTRTDLFAGADNLTADVLSSLGNLERVRPEQVIDYEVGVRLMRSRVTASLTGFAMEFRDEIAAIGQLSELTGLPLRRNVGRSYRRGLEAEATFFATHWLTIVTNASLNLARIREYPDELAGQTYRNVRPLLTPVFSGYVGPRIFLGKSHITLLADVQMRSGAYLSNANDARFRLPAATQLDAGIRYAPGRFGITYMFYNVTNTRYAAGGFTDGIRPYYFVLAPPNMFITLTYTR